MGDSRPATSSTLWIEFLSIYLALPVLVASARCRWRSFPVLPVLWVVAACAAWWLAAQGFRRSDFFGWQGLRQAWRGVLLRVGVAAAALTALVLWRFPGQFLELPRTRPVLWALVVLLYPFVSVYAQGVVYRAFYYRRYASLWPRPWLARLAGAAAFSLGHLVFLNGWALALTLVGGWWFGRTYERTRSLPVSNLEHALCGCLVFTLGLGRFLYHGTQALLQRLASG